MTTVATVPVWDRINDSAGNPIPNIDVFVTLNFNQATSASPVTNIEAVQQKVTTDPTGTWTVNVVPVNKLSPSGCLYNVRTPYQSYDINPTDVNVPVGPPAGWQSSSILVVVPPGLGPTLPNFNVSDILTAGSIQVTAGEPGIDTVGAGVLEIGGDNATTVEIGHSGVLVDANGNIAGGSLTVSGSNPYGAFLPGALTTPTPSGILTGVVWDWGGSVVNVQAAGALVDGATDDLVALTTSVTKGGAVRLGRGTSLVSTVFGLSNAPILFHGQGKDVSILKATAAFPATQLGTSGTFADFTIDGNNLVAQGVQLNSPTGLWTIRVSWNRIRRPNN